MGRLPQVKQVGANIFLIHKMCVVKTNELWKEQGSFAKLQEMQFFSFFQTCSNKMHLPKSSPLNTTTFLL